MWSLPLGPSFMVGRRRLENNIALVPVATLISSAIGGKPQWAPPWRWAALELVSRSPINPYTVGVAQDIAQLPAFSAQACAVVVVIGLSLRRFCKSHQDGIHTRWRWLARQRI